METKTFKVPAIHCGHCVHTIKMEVGDIPGVERVEAHPDPRKGTGDWKNPADRKQNRATLVEIKYPPEGLITIS